MKTKIISLLIFLAIICAQLAYPLWNISKQKEILENGETVKVPATIWYWERENKFRFEIYAHFPNSPYKEKIKNLEKIKINEKTKYPIYFQSEKVKVAISKDKNGFAQIYAYGKEAEGKELSTHLNAHRYHKDNTLGFASVNKRIYLSKKVLKKYKEKLEYLEKTKNAEECKKRVFAVLVFDGAKLTLKDVILDGVSLKEEDFNLKQD